MIVLIAIALCINCLLVRILENHLLRFCLTGRANGGRRCQVALCWQNKLPTAYSSFILLDGYTKASVVRTSSSSPKRNKRHALWSNHILLVSSTPEKRGQTSSQRKLQRTHKYRYKHFGSWLLTSISHLEIPSLTSIAIHTVIPSPQHVSIVDLNTIAWESCF